MADKYVPLPPSVITLWEDFEAATDPSEKGGIALQIAEEYLECHDDLNPDIPESISRLANTFERSRLKFGQSGTSLALALISILRNSRATTKQRENAN